MHRRLSELYHYRGQGFILHKFSGRPPHSGPAAGTIIGVAAARRYRGLRIPRTAPLQIQGMRLRMRSKDNGELTHQPVLWSDMGSLTLWECTLLLLASHGPVHRHLQCTINTAGLQIKMADELHHLVCSTAPTAIRLPPRPYGRIIAITIRCRLACRTVCCLLLAGRPRPRRPRARGRRQPLWGITSMTHSD